MKKKILITMMIIKGVKLMQKIMYFSILGLLLSAYIFVDFVEKL